jgi:hypothetical protein
MIMFSAKLDTPELELPGQKRAAVSSANDRLCSWGYELAVKGVAKRSFYFQCSLDVYTMMGMASLALNTAKFELGRTGATTAQFSIQPESAAMAAVTVVTVTVTWSDPLSHCGPGRIRHD